MADLMTMNPQRPNPQQPDPDYQNRQRSPSREHLRAIVGRHEAEVISRIGKRTSLEDRWIADLEQYHGRYDPTTAKVLFEEQRSGLFINATRPKSDALGSRLKDLLFPVDEKNWGIGPTPVPQLSEAAEQASAMARQKSQAAEAAAKMPQAAADAGAPPDQVSGLQDQAQATQQDADQAKQAAAMLTSRMEEGRKRADAMEKEIDDQLTECRYQTIKRKQIDCAVKLGTGITKGPVTGDKVRRGWKYDQQQQAHKLDVSTGQQPAFRYVDIWGFFPDMDATCIEEGNGVYERYLKNRKGLRELQFLDGFDKDAIRRLLQQAPSTSAPAYLAQLRNIRAATQQITGDLYHVFEYTGPFEPDDMRDIAMAMVRSRDETIASGANEALAQLDEIDPLMSVNGCLWFCQGEILKFSIYPLDSGETMYSVFNLVKDEASIFGYGMPAVIRDPQSALNGAFRALMDNAGVGSGPQVVIDMQNIEPEDGDYRLKARKIWRAKNGIQKENPPFQLFHIESRQEDMINIIQLCNQFIDTMSAVPQIIQGQTGEVGVVNPQQTALGTALLHNSANVVFRSIVKNFDDDVTTPDIRRSYDWNMQFNPKDEIKGDYEVDARGSSVLLMREMQAQNLMVIATQLSGHPIFGPMLRNRELLKRIFQAYMIPSDEVMMTDDEIDAVLAKAQQQSDAAIAAQQAAETQKQMMELENKKLEMQAALANQNNASKEKIAKLDYDRAMNETAAKLNMSLQELEGMLSGKEMDHASKERIFASEVAVEQRNAAAARAAGEIPKGSGGYVSGGATKKKRAA